MALEAEDLEQIKALIAESAKAQAEQLSKVFGEQLKPITERVKAVEEAAQAKPDDADEPNENGTGKGKDKGESDDAPNPEVTKLQAKLEALEARAKRAEQEQKQTEEKAKAERLQQAARDALLAAGVPGDRIRAAMATLKEDGLLEYDENGQPSFKFQRQTSAGNYHEFLAPKDGAAEWLKSDLGKIFLPPADVGGTGERGGRPPRPGGTGQPIDADTLARNLFARAVGG